MAKPEYRVRCVITGENLNGTPALRPLPLRKIRQERGAKRAGKKVERDFAQTVLAERRGGRQAQSEEETLEPEFISEFEAAMAAIQEADWRTTRDVINYTTEMAGGFEERFDDALFNRALETLERLDPIKTMANRTLDYLSCPLPITSPDQWKLLNRLNQAARHFYTRKGYLEAFAQMDANIQAQAFSKMIFSGMVEEKFTPRTIVRFIRSLARIRDADCFYYTGMFFTRTDIDPHSFIINLSSLYKRTAQELALLAESEGKTERELVALVAFTLEREADLLRIIQAQKFESVIYNRPVDNNAVLLPLVTYLLEAMENDRSAGIPADYEKYARKTLNALRARRCGLTDREIFAICSFLLGKIPKSIQNPSEEIKLPYHHSIPWIILRQLKQERRPEERYKEFRQKGLTHSDRLPVVCEALSRFVLAPEMTAPLVPYLLLEMRKIGYLKRISQKFYHELGIPPDVWEKHQEALQKQKEPLRIRQGDIVVFMPLSGWCLTNAHFDFGREAPHLAQLLVNWLEITTNQPIRKRAVKVVYTFGMHRPKMERGMPKTNKRIDLAEMATRREANLYVAPAGYIEEANERSIRIQELMEKYTKDFGVTWNYWTNENSPKYPGEGCFPIILGGSEKLGESSNGTRSTLYQERLDNPREDVSFLNRTGQIFALLKEDLAPSTKMSALVLGILQNFNRPEPGALVAATPYPELHSEKVANVLLRWNEAQQQRQVARRQNDEEAAKAAEKRAKKCEAAFLTMVPPSIAEEAWQMMSQRVGVAN